MAEKLRESTIYRGGRKRFLWYFRETDADVTGMTFVYGVRPLLPGTDEVDPTSDEVISGSGEAVAASGSIGPGWAGTLVKADTEGLDPDVRYLLQGAVIIDDEPNYTKGRIINVREPAKTP